MRVIYSLSHLQDWIEFAAEMKRRLAWEPVFWLTTPDTHDLVRKEFPSATRQSYREIISGVNPEGMDLFAPAGVDDIVFKEFAWEMDQALKMMDRLDSGDAFSYNERKNYFTRILTHSLNVVRIFKPQVIVFTETPHHATQYVLYAVCRRRGVHTIMFKPVLSATLRQLIYQGIEDDPLQTMGSATLDVVSKEDIEAYRAYADKLRGDYRQAEPAYVREQRRTSSYAGLMIATLRKLSSPGKIKALFDTARTSNILKLKNSAIEESLPNRLQLYLLKIKGRGVKSQLRKSYNSLVKPVPENTKFIFVPLHYQPERTSSPDGGTFVMQYLMVALLRRVLPLDVHIVVKEHSLQFHPKFDGHLGRLKEDYEHLAKLANVHLVDAAIPSFELIDRSFVVATVAGAVGLESIARKRPVLVFGAGCWFRSLKGVYFTPTEDLLRKAVSEIDAGVKLEDDDLADFLCRMHAISFVAMRNPAPQRTITVEDNVKALANAVTTYAIKVLKLHGG
jgi:hypothetical protein